LSSAVADETEAATPSPTETSHYTLLVWDYGRTEDADIREAIKDAILGALRSKPHFLVWDRVTFIGLASSEEVKSLFAVLEYITEQQFPEADVGFMLSPPIRAEGGWTGIGPAGVWGSLIPIIGED
jgi:hypothetical protein